ncbi:hypothetical protein CTAYLR_009543 [Chrysophaeum taylorii]|uniref:Uncharacterized protein n=1 Tax=Chrysophaeum taylorii TaxID=2483200 RepID=A0AAD7XHE8_9STRA|nr:hypothetical protein CTAYLR_009543 [Chrysophaeum taylorii]
MFGACGGCCEGGGSGERGRARVTPDASSLLKTIKEESSVAETAIEPPLRDVVPDPPMNEPTKEEIPSSVKEETPDETTTEPPTTTEPARDGDGGDDDNSDTESVAPLGNQTISTGLSTPLTKHDYKVSAADVAEVRRVLKSKQGWSVRKHCRDGRVRLRVLKLDAAETKLSWKDAISKTIKLDKVVEVRLGTILDPSTVGISNKRPKGTAGTVVLRRSADGQKIAKRAFSFILKDRTLDVETADEDECLKYCGAFQAIIEEARLKTVAAAAAAAAA